MPRKERKFIRRAIAHPGALTHDVGGPPSQHIDQVRHLAKHGTPAQRRRANFYLNVLRPINEAARAHH